MKSIFEYLLSNKHKGYSKKQEFPETFVTDDIVTFLENNDYVEIEEPTNDINKAYEKLQQNIKYNNIFITLKEGTHDVVIIRFCHQGEISEKNPIYCISTSKTGNIPSSLMKAWKEYGGNNDEKLTNNTKSFMLYNSYSNFFDEIKRKLFC